MNLANLINNYNEFLKTLAKNIYNDKEIISINIINDFSKIIEPHKIKIEVKYLDKAENKKIEYIYIDLKYGIIIANSIVDKTYETLYGLNAQQIEKYVKYLTASNK